MWGNDDKKQDNFMVKDDHNMLQRIDYLVEEMVNDDTLFEMVKNYLESVDDKPHECVNESQQLVEGIISDKNNILKLLVDCVEKEKQLCTSTQPSYCVI